MTKQTHIDDDYYALEKKRIAEEAQKSRRIHEEDMELHLVSHIPYYEEAPHEIRRCLVHLNNLLLHRFDKPGLIYWDFFKKTPVEIRDYAPDFREDFPLYEQDMIIEYFETQKISEGEMVEMGFDEDGEEDDFHASSIEREDGENDENTITEEKEE